jgi:hypothetical protein
MEIKSFVLVGRVKQSGCFSGAGAGYFAGSY